MSIVLQSSGGGSVTLQEPATASNLTATLPAATGTVMVSGNMPAFSAYQSSAQSLTANTSTKIQFQTEEFDTTSAFDNATNYRFTPQVAGYYQVDSAINFTSTRTYTLLLLYKNGSAFKISHNGDNTSGLGGTISTLVYMNGSTDYLEIYGFIGSTQNISASATDTWFQASMVRAA